MAARRLFGITLRGWMQLARWTVFGTLGCIALSVSFNYVFFSIHAPAALFESVVSATVIPILLAGPLFFYLTLKMRELAVANHKLRVLASTDSLTSCLNRGAFTNLVDGYLERLPRTTGERLGAMLVIDADHFKSINDRFGHHLGDEALKLIAEAIRTSIRKGDIVGRLGGEEFGVFLPQVSAEAAAAIAERIRLRIHDTEFMPDGRVLPISVSIGGAAFERRLSFSELFRIADERLYAAKSTGRDRVEMTFVPAGSRLGELAATIH